MNERERRHALTLNEAHEYFGPLEELSHRERLARLRFVKRRDGGGRADAAALEAMARYQLDRGKR